MLPNCHTTILLLSCPSSWLGKDGKNNKMHDLYMQFLSCRGNWNNCQLVVSATKSHESEHQELYQFLPKSGLIRELGTEALADDLISRHKDAESRLPPKMKHKYIKPYLIGFWLVSRELVHTLRYRNISFSFKFLALLI